MKRRIAWLAAGAILSLAGERLAGGLFEQSGPRQRPGTAGSGFRAVTRSVAQHPKPVAPLPAATDADRTRAAAAVARIRAERVERIRAMALDRGKLASFLERYRGIDRARLIGAGLLKTTAPAKGAGKIGPADRTTDGEKLLVEAKDILFALLFGGESENVRLQRVQRELLALTVPRSKADALEFLQAATELNAAGTWQDPESVSNDERADNVIIEVEYGEIAEEWIGDAILTALRLINNLEVNEQVLYARMIDVEQSTLVD